MHPSFPLVSIIVPIYMVEDYLSQCIDSVLAQSYTNLEIILVNDGSKDNCAVICEQYKTKDSRVMVIHQNNGGLSDARNTGLISAKGKFIFYLDSDDWLTNNCIELLVKAQQRYDCEVVQGNFFYSYDEYLLKDLRGFKVNSEIEKLDNFSAMSRLIENIEIKNFAWGKLIDAKVAKDEFFPKGKLFEDTFWTHRIIAKANRYIALAEPILYYRQRGDSISYDRFDARNLDRLQGLVERKNFIKDKYTNLFQKISTKCLEAHVEMYFQAKNANEIELAATIYSQFELQYQDFQFLSLDKFNFCIFKFSPSLYKKILILKRIKNFLYRVLPIETGLIKYEKKG